MKADTARDAISVWVLLLCVIGAQAPAAKPQMTAVDLSVAVRSSVNTVTWTEPSLSTGKPCA